MDFVHGTLFIAHNASFDIRMLVGEQELVDGVEFCVPQPYICSVRLARLAYPGLGSYKLGALVETLGIENGLAHSGLSDAMATAEMVIMLVARILKNPDSSLLKKITKLIGSTQIMGTSLPLLVQKAGLYPRGSLADTYQGQ
jgi:ATP-dependent DNA helicase DinG